MKLHTCVVLAILLLTTSFVSADVSSSLDDVKDKATDTVAGVNQVTQDALDTNKWSFLGQQWQEFLVSNKYIGPVHTFLQKINIVFVVLVSRDYSLSLSMLFVFMMWLFTLLSLPSYLFFIQNNSYRFFAALLGVVIIAHLNVFNYISTALFKILFYKNSAWWSFAAFIFIFVMLFVYLFLNKIFGKYLQVARQANEKRGIKTSIKEIKAEIGAQDKAEDEGENSY